MLYDFLFSKNKYQDYGINFGYKISVVKLQQLARRMIKNCDRWKANWEKVLEEIEPEVQKHFNNTVDRLCKDLSDEEIKILISKIKQLKEEQKDE
jgi:hypothetical protein